MQRFKLFLALGLLALGLVISSAALLLTRKTSVSSSSIGGAFSLIDQDGRVVTEQDLKGKVSLIFFGFTRCPDICPTKLMEISEILNELGPKTARMNAFFVTVDPERDRPETLKAYLTSFNPVLRGLTGTPQAINDMLKTYRAYARKVPTTGDDYTMDHTALVYIMDPSGQFVSPLRLERPASEVARDLIPYF